MLYDKSDTSTVLLKPTFTLLLASGKTEQKTLYCYIHGQLY